MDYLALAVLLLCVVVNRPSRQRIGLTILAVFSAHLLFAKTMLSSPVFIEIMGSSYQELWQWPYYISAAIFDSALFAILLNFFKRSSLRKDLFIIIILIVAVDLVGFLAYINYKSGDYYAGAMAAMNTILILRLMILTRHDRDGHSNYRFSGLGVRVGDTGDVLSGNKGAQRR